MGVDACPEKRLAHGGPPQIGVHKQNKEQRKQLISSIARGDRSNEAPDRGGQRSTNPSSTAGRFDALPTIQPVMYIHCVIRVSFGKLMFFGSSRGV